MYLVSVHLFELGVQLACLVVTAAAKVGHQRHETANFLKCHMFTNACLIYCMILSSTHPRKQPYACICSGPERADSRPGGPDRSPASRGTEIDAEQENRRAQYFKSRLCHNYMQGGHCNYGERCQYAHGPEELRRPHKDGPGRGAGGRGRGGGGHGMPPGMMVRLLRLPV